ncbi:MAG: hypothetical protein NTY93_01705 [Candidatus Kaiserbacteria bacterium]|nr:hypothetical protein [Candidatus Kaiserbacteria bacterium]
MRTFIIKLFLFLLPLGIFLAPAFIVLLVSGEFTPLTHIGALSRGTGRIVVGPAYSYFRSEYQLHETFIRRPVVIALGSSRVGEFHSEFFKNQSVFYNTSGSIGSLSGFTDFLKHLPQPPQIIIAGMDQYFFNPENIKNNTVTRPDPFAVSTQVYDPFFESFFRNGGWRKVYADYFSGKFTLADIFAPPKNAVATIGLLARVNDSGFTNDGSNYASVVRNPSEISKGIDALAKSITDTNGDEYGTGISTDALAELRAFLTSAKGKGITVIGFLPPITHKEYQALERHPDAIYAYAFKNLGLTLAAVYKEYGFDFYDFSDISSWGSSDDEMVESKHGSSKMYLRLFIRMAENNALLRPLVDLPALKTKLANATSTYDVAGIAGK